MDPLSDIIALLAPSAALAKPISGRGDWGVRYAAYGQPGFALILSGHCWLTIEREAPLRLDRGHFVLLPATPAFTLSSRPGIACIDVEPTNAPVRHGTRDGDPDVAMLGGAFRIDPVNAPLLIALLPRMIHIGGGADGSGDRIGRIIALIAEECTAERPGKDLIVERLLEIMLAECLRGRESDDAAGSAGLLAGMRDPALARSLRALRSNIRFGWTVADLAKIAGMSRSAFAARFADRIGCAPIEYLARWRMALARNALSKGGKSLDRLAEETGYESASAFSTAFRKRTGCSPGAFARNAAAA